MWKFKVKINVQVLDLSTKENVLKNEGIFTFGVVTFLVKFSAIHLFDFLDKQ